MALICAMPLLAQVDPPEDDDDDFDFSEFELAAPPSKSFCTNKVLGQTPTTLIGVSYDVQLRHDLTANSPVGVMPSVGEEVTINPARAFNIIGNFPLISKNNLLINMNLIYQRQDYSMEGELQHPLNRSLAENGLNRTATLFTVFKPLDDKRFILGQAGLELNGDYDFGLQSLSTLRVPAALLYGFKPNDRLMYAFGLSRTYLGGPLNYVPVVYYYHTFKDQRWGIEALAPARAYLRYRFSSLSLLSIGYNVVGATYRLNDFGDFARELDEDNPLIARDVELRRSEIRAGINFQKRLFGFFWLVAEAGYRINYTFELDRDGDFLRFWGDDTPYFIENDLRDTPYISIGISYMSP